MALVLDFHDDPRFGDEAFVDFSHLTNEGGAEFSKILAKAIAETEHAMRRERTR